MVALTQRRERFCRQYAFHGVGKWAAQEAGYAPRSARQRAHKLLSQAPVRARIAELRAQTVAMESGNRDAVLARLNFAYEKSMLECNPSAAIRALALQAKLTGLEPARPRLPVERAPMSRPPVLWPSPPPARTEPAVQVRPPAPADARLAALFPDMAMPGPRAASAPRERQGVTMGDKG